MITRDMIQFDFEERGYEMNTKHTPRPWCAIPEVPWAGGTWNIDTDTDIPIASVWPTEHEPAEVKANAALIAAAPDMATELARGRAVLCALRHWVPEDLLPAVNRVIVNMAHTIGKATGNCPPEADGRTEEAARAAIEEAAK